MEENNTLAKILGETLRAMRYEQGMTQAQLAEQAGCSKSTIAAIERGRANATLKCLDPILDELGAELKVEYQKFSPYRPTPKKPKDPIIAKLMSDEMTKVWREYMDSWHENRRDDWMAGQKVELLINILARTYIEIAKRWNTDGGCDWWMGDAKELLNHINERLKWKN